MLFKQRFLEGIRAGKVTLAFRQWRRPTVKAGGTLLTPVGQLAIRDVKTIDASALTSRDARLAGYASLDELRADLHLDRPGELYRIRFTLSGPDPRIALRDSGKLTKAECETLQTKLGRLDRRATGGPWTRSVLALIDKHPQTRAGDLAAMSNCDKQWLKLHVRKLKNLGLTESLSVGYRLSRRGAALLRSSH